MEINYNKTLMKDDDFFQVINPDFDKNLNQKLPFFNIKDFKNLVFFDIKNESHKNLINFLHEKEINIIPLISSNPHYTVISSFQNNEMQTLKKEDLKQMIVKNTTKPLNDEEQFTLDILIGEAYIKPLYKKTVLGNIKNIKENIYIDDRISNIEGLQKNKP